MVSFLSLAEGAPSGAVWFWRTESDAIVSKSFGLGSHVPIAVYWDATDGRLLACESAAGATKGEGAATSDKNQITTLFATPETIVVQHTFAKKDNLGPLIGVQVRLLAASLQRSSRAIPSFPLASSIFACPSHKTTPFHLPLSRCPTSALLAVVRMTRAACSK
jgi:hypothetical protein